MAMILLLQFKARRNLASVLEAHSGLQYSEVRDAIFSLQNIWTLIDITINYRKPVNDVLIDTTRSVIDHEHNLNIYA